MRPKRPKTIFEKIIQRQYNATSWRTVFYTGMVLVTEIMEREIRAHKVLHTEQSEVVVCVPLKNTMAWYDEHLVEKKIFSLPISLYDIVLTPSQEIIATDRNMKKIVKISPSGSFKTIQVTAPLEPCGICINSKHEIVVGLRTCYGKYPLKLAIYSSDYTDVLYEIENDEEGKPLFSYSLNEVKQNRSGDYVVADEIRVVCVTNKGRFRWEYHDKSAGIFALVCDKYDNVIIALDYRNCKICLLNSEGYLVTTLLTGEDYTYSLTIARNGHLWIGQNRNIKVVKYLR